MLRVGTSGFGYHGWAPDFYPSTLPHEDYLSYYARELDFCELNQTFFEFPAPGWSDPLLDTFPRGFVASVKLNRRLTHERSEDLALARAFAERVRPLAEAEALSTIVAQFPFAFLNNPDNRAYLCRLRAALELPLVVELRNPGWHRPETTRFLSGWGVGVVATDGPPPLGSVTSVQPFAATETTTSTKTTIVPGYVRFHGRRSELWWRDSRESRYDYRYRQKELLAWLPRVRALERDFGRGFVVFNNHGSPYALANVRAFKKLLARSESRRSRAGSRSQAKAKAAGHHTRAG